MEINELIKEVRKIELNARTWSNRLLSGEYHSRFKGKGMTFAENREYAYGDDVRAIDWNVSARLEETYVKLFEEERELSVFFIFDASASMLFGRGAKSKKRYALEVLSTIAFSASQNKDSIGGIAFSDKIDLVIPEKKGRKHILRLIRDFIMIDGKGKASNLDLALRQSLKMLKKRAIVFIFSDFQYSTVDRSLLTALGKKHKVMAINIHDDSDYNFPEIGLVPMEDVETGEQEWVNLNLPGVRKTIRSKALENEQSWEQLMKRHNIAWETLDTQKPIYDQLVKVFA